MTSVLTQKCPEGNTRSSVHRARLFCYTAFGDSPPTIHCQYHAYGEETCPSTGRRHWQGFVYFSNARTFSAVRKLLAPHHVEACRGSLADNERYCSKEGTYTEIGVKPSQGTRNDLRSVVDAIKDGTTTVGDIIMENPEYYHQYGRTLERAEDLINRSRVRNFVTQGFWFWGPTGSGKSRLAFSVSDDYYVKPSDGRWWDSYSGQHTVIIDDFRGDIGYSELLRLCDRYPMTVPRRGREPYPFLSKIIIITSALKPEEVYTDLSYHDSLDQLHRRFVVWDSRGGDPPLTPPATAATPPTVLALD